MITQYNRCSSRTVESEGDELEIKSIRRGFKCWRLAGGHDLLWIGYYLLIRVHNMESNGLSSLIDRGDCALIAADQSDAVETLCIDCLLGSAGGEAAAVAVTISPKPVTLLDRWRRSDRGRFRDATVLALCDADRSAAADRSVAGTGPGLGLVQSLDDSITVTELVARIEDQLCEWKGDGGRLAVYVDGVVDEYDSRSALDLADELSRVCSTHGAVGVVRVPSDMTAFPAIRSKFGTVVELEPTDPSPRSSAASLHPVEVFDALSSTRRLRVLRYLLDRPDSPTKIEELAREVARAEGDVSEPAVHRQHVGLVHTDLPTLADLGLVTFEPQQAVVEPTDSIARVEPFLLRAETELADWG